MTDLFKIASGFQQPAPKMRMRFGKIVSVQSDRTATVTIAGSTESVAGVKYMEGMTPKPNAVVTLLTDGTDLIILDHLCAANMTLSPRAYRSTDLSVVTATDTTVDWAAVNNDEWSCWAASPNPSRLTAPITGRYQAVAQVRWASNATGYRAGSILKDGTDVLAHTRVPAHADATPTQFQVVTPPFNMTAGEYIQLVLRQTSGGNLNFSYESSFNPSMSLIYLG